MITPPAGPSTTYTPDPRSFESLGGKMGKQEFLQLLVTQLRNQDPMNPSDPKDFAAQLAQFSTVEQLLNIGDQLKALQDSDSAMIATLNATSALQLIGKRVVVEGDALDVPASGDLNARIHVNGAGGSGELIVKDEAGVEVARVQLKALGKGPHTIDLNHMVGQLPEGRYSYAVEMTDTNGDPLDVTTFAVLRVDGVKYTPSGPVVSSGPLTIALGDVLEITD